MKLKSIAKGLFEIALGAALIGGALWVYRYLDVREGRKAARSRGTPVVETSRLKKDAMGVVLEAQGTTTANESVVLTARAQELVTKIAFEDGQFVRKGDLIVELENDQEIAEVKQAELNLAEEERELERIRPLYLARVSSEKDFDQQETAVARAKLLLSVCKTKLSERLVVVPFDGILGNRRVSLGALVAPGTAIATLDDVSQVKVDFTIPEKYLPQIRKGQKVRARSIAYDDMIFEGEVTNVSVRLNEVTRSVEVRAVIPNTMTDGRWILRPGMLLFLHLNLEDAISIQIPEKAVLSLGEIQYVYLYDPVAGVVRRREITLGQRRNGMVEILKGVEGDEWFVAEGVSKLTDEMKVEVANPADKRLPIKTDPAAETGPAAP